MIDEKQYNWILMVSLTLKEYNLPQEVCDFIACQFALECGYGSSHLAKEYNNICGMRVAFVRPSSQTNYKTNRSEFGHYRNPHSCIEDFMMWLSYQRVSPDRYRDIPSYSMLLLNTKYCDEGGRTKDPSSSNYIKSILSIYNQFISYGKRND